MEVGRRFGSTGGKLPVKFRNDWETVNRNLMPQRLREILLYRPRWWLKISSTEVWLQNLWKLFILDITERVNHVWQLFFRIYWQKAHRKEMTARGLIGWTIPKELQAYFNNKGAIAASDFHAGLVQLNSGQWPWGSMWIRNVPEPDVHWPTASNAVNQGIFTGLDLITASSVYHVQQNISTG